MQPFSKNLLFWIVIAILFIATILFGTLYLQVRSELGIQNQEIQNLQQQIKILKEKVNEETQRKKEEESIDTLRFAPSSIEGWKTYRSKHNFIIDYPASWRLSSTIESLESIEKAEHFGGNRFSIYSYEEDIYDNPGAPVSQNEIKIEVRIFNNLTQSLDQWIASSDILHTEDILINGKEAKKVWSREEGVTGQYLAVYYIDDGKGVIFVSWPYDTIYSQEFNQILSTFKFIE